MHEDQILKTTYSWMRVRWLANNAVRITHAPPAQDERQAALFSFPPDRPWMEHVFLPHTGLSGDGPELLVEAKDDLVQVLTRNGRQFFSEACPPLMDQSSSQPYLSLDIPKIKLGFGRRRVEKGIKLSLSIGPDEAFYGWGEWFNAFRRDSGEVRLRIRDAIALLQDRHTYSAIPLFLSSRGYAFFLLNSHASRWRIDPKAGLMEVEADGPGADYILIYGPFFRRILQTYTALTGRPPLPPRWAFGLWVTSYPQGDQEGVLAHVHEHRKRAIPLDAVILDYHWEQRFHNFRWRSKLFPDPDGLIADLKGQGVRLGLILTPFLNRRNRPLQKFLLNSLAHNIPRGHFWDDERVPDLYKEARQQGFLAHENAKWWFGSGGMLDFANPPAADWWNDLMRPLYRQGVAFFKNDDGEYLPENASSALGEQGMDGGEYHNIYGFYYGRALYKGMSKLDQGDPTLARRSLIYARSVWAGSQRYPALFLGDQKPTYEGIRSTMRAGLNLGLLGFAYWTADVFGLDGKTTPETHMRYAQWALLAPVARYFWRPPKIDDTRFPWSHNQQVEDNFRKYAELRYRLLPYYVALAWEAYKTGLPILRPLVLSFQHNQSLLDVYDQVMLGERLMLCPVIEPGATSRRILLPEGVWHDFWSDQEWRGPGEIDYQAPLDCLPILVRGGTALPLGPVLTSIPDDHRFDQLEWHLWPPYPAKGDLYDEDGHTMAYQSGACSHTHLNARGDDAHLIVRMEAAQGWFPGQVGARQTTLRLQRAFPPQRVTLNGRRFDGWRYDDVHRETVVQLVCPTKQETVVEIFTAAEPTPHRLVF